MTQAQPQTAAAFLDAKRAQARETTGNEEMCSLALELLEAFGAGDARGESLRSVAAADALRGENADPEHARAVKRTADALQTALNTVAPAVLGLRPSDATWLEQGIPRWDATAADAAEHSLGQAGKAWARDVRLRGRKRAEDGHVWGLWVDAEHTLLCRAAASLARAHWMLTVAPQLERERRNPAALVIQVHESVALIHSRAQPVADPDAPIVQVPSVEDASVVGLVERGATLLGSLTAHRLLRWELLEGHRRAMGGEPDPRQLVVAGGWSTLAELLSLRSKYGQDLRAIVYAQASTILRKPTGETGNLIAVHELPSVGRRRGRIEITLMPMLMPNYAHELSPLSGRQLYEANRLVPMLPIPPMVGRNRDHGAQATLSMLVVAELRRHAVDLVTVGAVRIDEDRLGELATRAALPLQLVPKVIDRWTQDGSDGPAFLEARGPDRYALGLAHPQQRAFLEEAGQRSQGARRGGQRSAAARRRKRRGRVTR